MDIYSIKDGSIKEFETVSYTVDDYRYVTEITKVEDENGKIGRASWRERV